MSFSLDDFITYNDELPLKTGNVFDIDFSLSSPFSENSDSVGAFPPFLPKTIQNLLDTEANDLTKHPLIAESPKIKETKKPRKAPTRKNTKKSQKEDSQQDELLQAFETLEPVPEGASKNKKAARLHTESKRITKRKVAKERVNAKRIPTETLLERAEPKHIPKELNDPDLDDDTKKKMIQMIRNRVSAQNSRDRKRFYIQQLEEMRDLLEEENAKLGRDKLNLKEKLREMEIDREALVQEISILKKGVLPACSNCGFTLEFNGHNVNKAQETTDDNSSQDESRISTPEIERGTSRGLRGLFGFSMTFTTLLCLFFVLSIGEKGQGPFSGNNKTTFVARPIQIPSEFSMGVCKKIEKNETDTLNLEEIVDTPTDPLEDLEETLNNIDHEQAEIISKIKPQIEQFIKFHKSYYELYKNKSLIIDLSKAQSSEYKLLNASSLDQRNSTKKLLGETSPILSPNRTSTVFCPSGFEFFKANSTMDFGSEKNEGLLSTLNAANHTLDLEKAEFVQLLLPKQAIGRLGVTENSSEIFPFQDTPKAEEQNSFVEVWCKIYAIRDFVASF